MAADIVESAELLIGSANHEQWLADELSGEVTAGLGDLVAMSDELPGAGEDAVAFFSSDSGVEVERRGESRGAGDVGVNNRGVEQGHRVWGGSHCTAEPDGD